ncbi:MAG TPA: acyl-CoA dehydrogenase family protein [Clostridia bacterium]|nr:acyl-CoA dehydrogenase family protein [Clostridia bacterium]
MQFFQFTEEQDMLRKAVREFVEAEIAPKAAEWDDQDYFPIELFPAMGEMGIAGIFVPEEFGGAGMGHVERAICIEEIARHSGGLAIAMMTHHLGIAAILDFGSEDQKKKYLPELCAGTKLGGLAVTEPGGGSDFSGQKTTAELLDGQWVLNGRKCFITNHNADVNIITTVTGKDEKGRNQLSAFIVEKGTPGFAAGRKEHKMGLRGSVTGDVILNDVKVPEENLIGKAGAGAKIGMTAIGEVGRAGMSAICVGILRGCVEEAVKFANERVLYGKPIAKLQAIQLEVANIRTDYEAAKLLLYFAAGKKDAKQPATPDFALAKYYSSEAAVRSSKRTMDLMGGYGVINEYPVGRFLRDALASIPSGGTSHIQQLIIAGNTLSDFKA